MCDEVQDNGLSVQQGPSVLGCRVSICVEPSKTASCTGFTQPYMGGSRLPCLCGRGLSVTVEKALRQPAYGLTRRSLAVPCAHARRVPSLPSQVMRPGATLEEAQELVSEVDVNGDGQLDYDEVGTE